MLLSYFSAKSFMVTKLYLPFLKFFLLTVNTAEVKATSLSATSTEMSFMYSNWLLVLNSLDCTLPILPFPSYANEKST